MLDTAGRNNHRLVIMVGFVEIEKGAGLQRLDRRLTIADRQSDHRNHLGVAAQHLLDQYDATSFGKQVGQKKGNILAVQHRERIFRRVCLQNEAVDLLAQHNRECFAVTAITVDEQNGTQCSLPVYINDRAATIEKQTGEPHPCPNKSNHCRPKKAACQPLWGHSQKLSGWLSKNFVRQGLVVFQGRRHTSAMSRS